MRLYGFKQGQTVPLNLSDMCPTKIPLFMIPYHRLWIVSNRFFFLNPSYPVTPTPRFILGNH